MKLLHVVTIIEVSNEREADDLVDLYRQLGQALREGAGNKITVGAILEEYRVNAPTMPAPIDKNAN